MTKKRDWEKSEAAWSNYIRDFDVRRYGYSLLSKFLETFPKLKLLQDGTKVQ